MKFLRSFLLQSAIALGLVRGVAAQSLGDLLGPDKDLSNPAHRAEVVAQMQGIEGGKRDAARAKAVKLGMPQRVVKPNGAVMELMDFSGNQPVYFTTHNVNAAISSGANLLQSAPFSLTGAGVTVGVWDGGAVRSTHQEFGARVTVKDGAANLDHSTHVGGTIAAAGVVAAAKGIATGVSVDSYEWTNDKSEMTARAAAYPGEAGKIYLSNQSYGYISGWNYTGKVSPVWDWWGNGTSSTGVEQDFGKYDTNARDTDSLAASAPYFLMFHSAGNERTENPATGQTISLTPNGAASANYDAALHPPGDGLYKTGYDTLGFEAVAKNSIVIGSVTDAVSGNVRNVGSASLNGFSSIGPTDDGRIKPDVVANGDNLYSSLAGSNLSYGTYSGTSMATPNATGSAALLVQYFDTLFPGQAMRASTLKALLIHTADDRGTAGPDYQYGWGLINVKAAADALNAYHANPGNSRIIESRLTSAVLTRTHSFTWDGTSPIRATLVWTDPAGTSTTTADSRTARLVNNLDLKITAPGGANFSPFVMPYVGNWTNGMLSAAATTGKNNTDNVEQVLISAPSSAGVYQAVVSVDGTLTNALQNYSLIITGSSNVAAAAPTASAVSPTSGTSGSTVLNITGTNILLGSTVKLTKAGQPDIVATAIESLGDTVKCRADITGRASGLWNVIVTNPDGQTATLASAFSIIGALWQDDFESGATGWTHGNSQGSTDNWALVTTQNHSATHSYFAAGPSSTNINDLNSPTIAVSPTATNLTLSFWHNYNFENRRDGGVLEFSVDGGAWFDVTDATSGASFATGGYNSTFSTNGNPNNRNPLAPRSCWTGTNSGFTQVVVNLTNTAKYAGHNLRIRCRLATNSSTSSTGWYLDDIALNGGGGSTNLPPSITTDAAATPSPVTGTTTALSVAASDDAGEPGLSYTWSYTGGAFETPVSFSENGTNAAKATTATFTAAGSYTFTVTARDGEGLTTTSSVDVVVEQTPTGMVVTPSTANVTYGTTQIFAATEVDQFGDALPVQSGVTWSTSGGGSIAADGTFTANSVGGPFTITATSVSYTGMASVTVSKAHATVTLGSLAQTYSGAPKSATAITSPSGLAVTFTYDGSSTAPTNAGSYAVVGTINDSNYSGSASGTLVVSKATATVTLGNLAQTYNSTPRTATATTSPSGLTVTFTYDGSSTAPVDFGSYSVVATINDANYSGSASGTLLIAGQTLASWRAQYFSPAEITAGLADDMADPDGDNWSNLAEYALGTDPRNSTPQLSPHLNETGFTLTFTRPKALPDVICSAECSADFQTWNPLTLELITDGPVQTLRARVLFTGAVGEKQFIRLRFSH